MEILHLEYSVDELVVDFIIKWANNSTSIARKFVYQFFSLQIYFKFFYCLNVDIPDKNSTKSRKKLTEWKIRSQKLLDRKIKLNCFERLNASKWIQETQFSISLSTKWWYGTKGYQFANTYEPETEICWTRWNQRF